MLSKGLQYQEVNLVISRKVLNTRPIAVSYCITTYSLGALPVTETLVQMGVEPPADDQSLILGLYRSIIFLP